jgi:hypothetical protein
VCDEWRDSSSTSRSQDRVVCSPIVRLPGQSQSGEPELQYALQDRARQLDSKEVEVIDEDLGCYAAGTGARTGFEGMVAEICLGACWAVAARSSIEICTQQWQIAVTD